MRHVLILSDGKAGHVSSSRGMAGLLAEDIDAQVETCEIRLRAKCLRPLLRLLTNTGLACRLSIWFGEGWLGLFYQGFRPLSADALISAGGDTLYLNAYAGRCRGIANFFCGSLRGVRAEAFRLIVHTRHASLENWRALSVLPIQRDPEGTALAAESFVRERLAGRRDNLWTLMIGGPGNGYRFDDAQVVAMLEQCATLAAHHGKLLLVSTSRRTGQGAEDAIAGWLERHLQAPVAYTVLFGRRPERLAAIFMHLAEVVFCSEESTSMLSEGVHGSRPVVSLAPADARPVPDQAEFLERLEARGYLLRLPLGDTDAERLRVFLASWQPYDGLEQRCLRDDMLACLPKPSAASGTPGSAN